MTDHDDAETGTRGPLAQLFAGLGNAGPRPPARVVHRNVLNATQQDGSQSIVLCSFRGPKDARELFGALKGVLEAALLSELSRPIERDADDGARLFSIELYAFEPFAFDAAPALAPFGLVSQPVITRDNRRALALVRSEAQQLETRVAEEPCLRFSCPVTHVPDAALKRALAACLSSAALAPWGAAPGSLARALIEALEREGVRDVEPSRDGIAALEARLVPDVKGALRWPTPLGFQALCDLTALAAELSFARRIEWGVCELDPETGLAPPPVLRVDGEHVVPLGQHVLGWSVMPLAHDEHPPLLADWAAHEFSG